jgi:hypothetical protein
LRAKHAGARAKRSGTFTGCYEISSGRVARKIASARFFALSLRIASSSAPVDPRDPNVGFAHHVLLGSTVGGKGEAAQFDGSELVVLVRHGSGCSILA